jgi:hypothetical protein
MEASRLGGDRGLTTWLPRRDPRPRFDERALASHPLALSGPPAPAAFPVCPNLGACLGGRGCASIRITKKRSTSITPTAEKSTASQWLFSLAPPSVRGRFSSDWYKRTFPGCLLRSNPLPPWQTASVRNRGRRTTTSTRRIAGELKGRIRRSLVKIIELYSTMLRARRSPKMPLLASLVLAMVFAAGIFFTGCTSLARGFNWVHAEMTKPPTDEDTHNYGAFFTTPRSLRSDEATK